MISRSSWKRARSREGLEFIMLNEAPHERVRRDLDEGLNTGLGEGKLMSIQMPGPKVSFPRRNWCQDLWDHKLGAAECP